jgi:predicted LPLAT superfamily acyltransferase
MSQPENTIAHSAVAMNREALVFIAHLGHMMGLDALQESRGFFEMKLLVVRQDAQKEFVTGCALEPFDIE